MEIGLLLLRLTVGLTLAAHGAQKLFGWFGGPGLDATGQGLAALGFHPGRRHALMAGLVEAGGGLLLAVGFLTPVAAAIVFSVMLVAGVSVHGRQGFFITTGGYEYTLVLGIAGLTIAFTGPGALSVDALLGLTMSGGFWGVAAFIVGLVGGAIQLAQRRPAPSLHAAHAK
jgi:putative oxidoreductase